MEPLEGFEPPSCAVEVRCFSPLSYRGISLLVENNTLYELVRIDYGAGT